MIDLTSPGTVPSKELFYKALDELLISWLTLCGIVLGCAGLIVDNVAPSIHIH